MLHNCSSAICSTPSGRTFIGVSNVIKTADRCTDVVTNVTGIGDTGSVAVKTNFSIFKALVGGPLFTVIPIGYVIVTADGGRRFDSYKVGGTGGFDGTVQKGSGF